MRNTHCSEDDICDDCHHRSQLDSHKKKPSHPAADENCVNCLGKGVTIGYSGGECPCLNTCHECGTLLDHPSESDEGKCIPELCESCEIEAAGDAMNDWVLDNRHDEV